MKCLVTVSGFKQCLGDSLSPVHGQGANHPMDIGAFFTFGPLAKEAAYGMDHGPPVCKTDEAHVEKEPTTCMPSLSLLPSPSAARARTRHTLARQTTSAAAVSGMGGAWHVHARRRPAERIVVPCRLVASSPGGRALRPSSLARERVVTDMLALACARACPPRLTTFTFDPCERPCPPSAGSCTFPSSPLARRARPMWLWLHCVLVCTSCGDHGSSCPGPVPSPCRNTPTPIPSCREPCRTR